MTHACIFGKSVLDLKGRTFNFTGLNQPCLFNPDPCVVQQCAATHAQSDPFDFTHLQFGTNCGACMPALLPTCSSLTPLTLHLPSTPSAHTKTSRNNLLHIFCTPGILDPCVPIIHRSGEGTAHTQAQPCIWANNKQTLLGQGTAHTVADLNPDTASDDPDKSLALFVVKANLKVTC